MYKEYLRYAYEIYKRIEDAYPESQGFSSKRNMYYVLSRKLHIPVCDIEAASIIIENNYSEILTSKSFLIAERVQKLIQAKAEKDMETVKRITVFLKNELKISTNTLNKYIKVVVFQDSIEGYGRYRKDGKPWTNPYNLSCTRQFFDHSNLGISSSLRPDEKILNTRHKLLISSIMGRKDDVQDKPEESIIEATTNETESSYNTEFIDSEESNLEILRQELASEVGKCSCIIDDVEVEGFFKRTSRKVKRLLTGK